jgi:hypothetical protein
MRSRRILEESRGPPTEPITIPQNTSSLAWTTRTMLRPLVPGTRSKKMVETIPHEENKENQHSKETKANDDMGVIECDLFCFGEQNNTETEKMIFPLENFGAETAFVHPGTFNFCSNKDDASLTFFDSKVDRYQDQGETKMCSSSSSVLNIPNPNQNSGFQNFNFTRTKRARRTYEERFYQ